MNTFAGAPAPTVDYEAIGNQTMNVSTAGGKEKQMPWESLVALKDYLQAWGLLSRGPVNLPSLRRTWYWPATSPKADIHVVLQVLGGA